MGTRGLFGVVIDGTEKLTYNHFDSYPEGLGVTTLDWLRSADLADVYAKARALQLVADTEPDPNSKNSLYWRLRDCQGNWQLTLDAGVMEEGGWQFALDSLFCEWGYVLDLDHPSLEVYRGFQKKPHTEGRFADRFDPNDQPDWRSGGPYYPIRLIARYGLEALPSNQRFLDDMREIRDAEDRAYYQETTA